ncbi:hypothetical protein VTN77DRAFT_5413 [Rasamsonia byssochlamydoides]|uniref:uncharacterized protein n=1 Tax=Rasamsonia byssochlamydoides TaxID=89139 RepID=UPI0037440DD1
MQHDVNQLIESLRTHRINNITDLRRVERIFAHMDTAEVTEPMTRAWYHYVTSNNLLSELRNLTRNYPFSSECLDEAKMLVVGDPESSRSWNYCWLVLVKIEKMNLIPKHARELAARPQMWGGIQPSPEHVNQLANACIEEWTRALRHMLRHWDAPPTVDGKP